MIKLKNRKKDIKVKAFLKQQGLSQRTITELSKELGLMKIDEKSVIMTDLIKKNQTLNLHLNDSKISTTIPKSTNLPNIIFEDEHILVVDKPSNLPTIPSFNYEDSLASQVMNYLKTGIFRAMNRLDADTTGCVLIVKNVIIENLLQAKGNIKKEYVAIVEGKTPKNAIINIPIKDAPELKKRIVCNDGLPAITHFKRIKYSKKDNFSIIRCNLKYGRTNQIRCHLSAIGHPLVGDSKYGSNAKIDTFFLRCYHLKFKHPITKKTINIKLKKYNTPYIDK